MTVGTKIIERSLEHLGVSTPVSPANPESIQSVKDVLNGMIARWEDEGILMGCVPLKEPGSELSEPLGARNGIEFNLAIEAAPLFPAANLSPLLIRSANKTYNEIKRRWKTITIPNAKVRGTLPKGQGNWYQGYDGDTFFDEGEDIG